MAKAPAKKTATSTKARTTAAAKSRSSGKRAAAATPKAKATAATDKATKIKATPSDFSDREHLVTVIQEGTGASRQEAKQTLDSLLDTVTVSLKKNKKVQLLGFGTFRVLKRPARRGRNFATGESIRIKSSKGVRFKPGTKLKDAI